MATASVRMPNIKIRDLLDFSLPLGSSSAPGGVLPLSGGTVHHRPLDFIPDSSIGGYSTPAQMPRSQVKIERETDEERCPNVCVMDGVICMPYRPVKEEEEGAGQARGHVNGGGVSPGGRHEQRPDMMAGVMAGAYYEGYREKRGSSVFPSPPLDSQNLTTKQLLNRLHLTRKLLSLKKLALKNRVMAINLETLLPRAMEDSSPFHDVPMVWGDDHATFGDFSSASMYGGDDLLGGVSTFDPSLSKPLTDGMQYGETLYQMTSPDVNDSWMTTPISLPLTPDEPLGSQVAMPTCAASVMATPPVPSVSYAITPTSYSSTPLTPDSLVSPHSTCEGGEELAEVLSYFEDGSSSSDVGPDVSTYPASLPYPSPCFYVSSAAQSPYTPLTSTPNSPSFTSSPGSSPLTPNTPPSVTTTSPLVHQPATPTPASPPTPFAPYHHSPVDMSVSTISPPPSSGVSDSPAQATPTSRGLGVRGKGGAGRRRVNASVKKERKREQNKSAALRYRQKKKEEKLEIDVQQQILEVKNSELKQTLKGLEAELGYLKRLWAEMQEAKKRRCD